MGSEREVANKSFFQWEIVLLIRVFDEKNNFISDIGFGTCNENLSKGRSAHQ